MVAKKAKAAVATEKSGRRSRSAYFARREAAKILRSVLQGDERRQAIGSIKSLVYSPSVSNKRATFALVCQTLKYFPIIKDVLEFSDVLSNKWKRQKELMYIVAYDILFGQEAPLVGGDAEKFLLRQKEDLQSALAELLVRKKVKHIDQLISLYHPPDISKPCYVRVNTLRLDVDSALQEFEKQFLVQKDDLLPDLLILPPHTDLHNHHLIANGSVFIQGKASSMVGAALDPRPGWDVLDACAAPGNKTVHLAALMGGKGRILACELNKQRVNRLKDTIMLSGATNIEVLLGDFLSLDPKDRSFSKVRAILLDPSCSGSGTASQRLDHLLPSHSAEFVDAERLNRLAAFQKKALSHAFSFPAVERIVYSTCSVNQIENEDVVYSVLPLAASFGFRLATPFAQWYRRGFPTFEGSEHLLRTDPVEDKEGFFIALFVKQGAANSAEERNECGSIPDNPIQSNNKKYTIPDGKPMQSNNRRYTSPVLYNKLSRIWLHTYSTVPRRSIRQKAIKQRLWRVLNAPVKFGESASYDILLE
ncbi:hypothetical protein K2173_026128 [Erythroxylum novogranatense]|uniref:SAM-dependent MTase RsmB/NOP-type domain-containing protein n=1 Tax=Erythroxylum novogranatense TaxID=1862640 RepID=A0AAV8TZH5_9ROSI|nr:hypothetical protein K2173_026128 [Erythroxylum novogranatense]